MARKKAESKGESPWVRLPAQDRSQRTLLRLLDATERLLAERPFEAISIQDVVREARSSVGSFYARFEGKEALLHALDERYLREGLATTESRVAEIVEQSRDLDEAMEALYRMLIRAHSERHGLLRALVLHARTHPNPAFQKRGDALLRSMLTGLDEIVAAFAPWKRSKRARQTARFAFMMGLHAVREHALFPEGPAQAAPMSEAKLAEELARTFVLYTRDRLEK